MTYGLIVMLLQLFRDFQIDLILKHTLCSKRRVIILIIQLNFAQHEAFLSRDGFLSMSCTHSNGNPNLLYPGLKLELDF
jgi:hypothetical protein